MFVELKRRTSTVTLHRTTIGSSFAQSTTSNGLVLPIVAAEPKRYNNLRKAQAYVRESRDDSRAVLRAAAEEAAVRRNFASVQCFRCSSVFDHASRMLCDQVGSVCDVCCASVAAAVENTDSF